MSPKPFRRALASVATAAACAQVLGLGCGGSGQATAPVNPEPALVVPEAHGPLLWQIEGETGPSYLFGTVHLGATLADVGPEVTRALGEADVFISEADLNLVDQIELAKMAVLPEGQRLEAQIGAESFAELVRLLSPGLPRAQLDRLQPWLAYTSALQILYGGGMSIDSVLANSAKQAGKQMIYLEDWRFQLGLLADQVGAEDLKGILDPGSDDRATIEALLLAYRQGDFGAVSKIIAGPEAIARDPAEFKALFEDRNRAWVPLLLAHLKRGKAFVAVGAGHYAGDVGLLQLLSEAGLKPVRARPTSSE